MLRGIDSSLNPLNVPYALRRMKGGVTAFDTANDLLSFIISYNYIKNSAYEAVQKYFVEDDEVPPTYFKLGTLHEIKEDQQEIHITLAKSMPIANTGDGVKKIQRQLEFFLTSMVS